ncbi:MAG: dicarboxylate/amino acid:cation symporter [Verrucomicrobia bacterium]|nr:dicarboxylate/amino acid:cation symporter [Verrucomicrobiota bacterium]
MSGHDTHRLAVRILRGFAAGLLAGIGARWLASWRPEAAPGIEWFAAQICDPLGQVFLRLLFWVVAPLVFASLTNGMLQLGRLDRLGPLAWRTFALFAANMVIGATLGLLILNLLNPGEVMDPESRQAMLERYGGRAGELEAQANRLESFSLRLLVDLLLPANLLKAIVEFQMLPLIGFALLIGGVGLQLGEGARQGLGRAMTVLTDLMTGLIHAAMRLAPYAVPAMIFGVVARLGWDYLQSLLLFLAGVLAAMAIHLFGVLSLAIRCLAGQSPRRFFRAIRTVLVTAFSTSSSNATLPTSIQVARENLGISAPTAGFVLPLGATMNMSGTALYEGCVVLFIAQVYGLPLSLPEQALLVGLAVLSAVAVAGIPGGSLPLIVGLLVNFGLPSEGIALVLGADRLLDMARTTVNSVADLVTACVVDRSDAGGEPAEPPP